MVSERTNELYKVLLDRGYSKEFCAEIAYRNMNTDYTGTRMLGYLYQVSNPRIEDLVDEMLAILSDRDAIIRKKEMEKFIPINKKSKKAQKAYYAKKRNTWGELNPMTRTMPNGKGYNRKKLKQEDRRNGSFSQNNRETAVFGCQDFCTAIYCKLVISEKERRRAANEGICYKQRIHGIRRWQVYFICQR